MAAHRQKQKQFGLTNVILVILGFLCLANAVIWGLALVVHE